MWDKLFYGADLMQKGLSAVWTRDSVIRNNIANAETPNFKASDVEFESILASAIENSGFEAYRTNEQHYSFGVDFSNLQAQVHQRRDTAMRYDENNVDIENENVKLAQNRIQYNAVLAKLNGELTRIKLAITEGGK